MKRVLYLLMAVLLLHCPMGALWAQYRPLGATPEDSIYQREPLAPERVYGKGFHFPIAHSMKNYCPTPGDQNDYASCVGWASSYAFSISLAIRSGVDHRSPDLLAKLKLSALYIYNQIKLGGDCYYGARTSDAMHLLKNQGDCRATLFPNNLSCEMLPSQVERSDAFLFRISDYWRVFGVQNESAKKIDLTKKMLLENKPVVAAFEVTPSFMNNKSSLWVPDSNESKIGLHTVVIIGYDEHYFELLNSFGTGWGNGGYIKISHEDYARYVRYAYIMCLETAASCSEVAKSQESLELEPLYGDFDLIEINDETTKQLGGNYNIKEGFFEIKPSYGDDSFFQLQAKSISHRANVYFFMTDKDGRVEYLDEIRTYQPGLSTEYFTIPRGNQLFAFEKGDWLCVLLSHDPIPGFRSRLSDVAACLGSLREKLDCTFDQEILDETKIIRWTDDFSLAYIPQPQQKGITPLLIKFD